MATTGAIDSRSGRPAPSHLDGQPRGLTPFTLPDVSEGDHELVIEAGGSLIRQRVVVQADLTTSWVRRWWNRRHCGGAGRLGHYRCALRDAGARGGAARDDRDDAPAARARPSHAGLSASPWHSQVGERRRCRGEGNPRARPTAQRIGRNQCHPLGRVWIDGQKAGETPIGNMALTLGPHELIFKHPIFGRRHAVSVTAGRRRASASR